MGCITMLHGVTGCTLFLFQETVPLEPHIVTQPSAFVQSTECSDLEAAGNMDKPGEETEVAGDEAVDRQKQKARPPDEQGFREVSYDCTTRLSFNAETAA